MSRRKTVSISRKPTGAEKIDEPAPAEFQAEQSLVLREGMAEARPEAGPGERPPRPGLVGRAVYRSAYGLSFGMVFGSLLLARLMPGGRLVARGLKDGARAACRYEEEGRAPQTHARFEPVGSTA